MIHLRPELEDRLDRFWKRFQLLFGSDICGQEELDENCVIHLELYLKELEEEQRLARERLQINLANIGIYK